MARENRILEKVEIKRRVKARDFLRFVPTGKRARMLAAARSLYGKRVVHVNATAAGGGVAEILQSLIPYFRALDIQCDWYALSPKVGGKFFETTNKIHDSLQGAKTKITAAEWKEYERVNRALASELQKIDCDILVINDPQPLAAGAWAKDGHRRVYISHIDTSTAYGPVWKRVFPFIRSYKEIVFSSRAFVHGSLLSAKVKIFPPAIDPLAPKQEIVPRAKARGYLSRNGRIPKNCPLIVQVSRFDVWKNPLGVIEAVRIVQKSKPDIHLALVGFNEAKDNPAAREVYRDIAAVAAKSPNVSLFFDPRGKDILKFTVMAQNGADIMVQNSIREGFGLVIAEAMWKRQTVIGGPAEGPKMQIKNGKNGFIVKTPEELAEKILWLLEHPARKSKMGEAARRGVAKNFLLPRLMLDHLRLYRACLK